ncbi:MAG: hypothetical protein R3B09_13120 [Nannocystaceae bacterium]
MRAPLASIALASITLASVALASVALACTPAGSPRDEPPLAVTRPPPASATEPASVEPVCPAGSERRSRGGEGPDADAWACVRGEVRHGPFVDASFDPRDRTWSTIRGVHVDGERDGVIETIGFRTVGSTGRERVFGRDVYQRGRLLRSNVADARAELTAERPTALRRFQVQASGLVPPPAEAAIGAVDVEVWATWSDAPVDAAPSVLRVEVRGPEGEAPTIVDGLLYPIELASPPETGSGLAFGELPRAWVTWATCEADGCAPTLDVTLRWIVAGPGRVDAGVRARAVPEIWPAEAPIDVRLLAGE